MSEPYKFHRAEIVEIDFPGTPHHGELATVVKMSRNSGNPYYTVLLLNGRNAGYFEKELRQTVKGVRK